MRWVIVDDASTDGTAHVVRKYSAKYEFLKLVSTERKIGRHFGNKVAAFNRGLGEIDGLPFDFIGNLDADISFGPDYFEKILAEFRSNPKLGVAGGMVNSLTRGKFVSQDVALDSVAGAVQMFRRECFDDVGGYTPLPHGGIDSAAEITARMKGWTVQTFPEFQVLEHRRTGSAVSGTLTARMKEGRLYYSLGYSPYFHFMRCLYRAKEQPMFLGSIAELVGFLVAAVRGEKVVLRPDIVRYLRGEQRSKLKLLLQR